MDLLSESALGRPLTVPRNRIANTIACALRRHTTAGNGRARCASAGLPPARCRSMKEYPDDVLSIVRACALAMDRLLSRSAQDGTGLINEALARRSFRLASLSVR